MVPGMTGIAGLLLHVSRCPARWLPGHRFPIVLRFPASSDNRLLRSRRVLLPGRICKLVRPLLAMFLSKNNRSSKDPS